MKQLKLTIALAAMALFTTTGAHASLLGDSVTLNIYSTNGLAYTGNTTVGNGVEFSNLNQPTRVDVNQLAIFFFPGESLDITSNSINLVFTAEIQRTFEITGIDAIVSGATSSSGTISNISTTASSVSFLYTAGNTDTTGTVNLTFRDNQSAVPEPGTTALLVSGLAGIFFYRRKR
jgi:hypothetical protein